MAATLTMNLLTRAQWLFQDPLDLSTPVDTAILEYTKQMATGTGADQADRIWHDTRTLATATNDDLDMTALTNSIFGSTVTINFVKVKGIYIVNTSTTAGEELILDSSVTNGFLGPFNGSATSKVEIGPASALWLSSAKDGWTVTGGTGDILRVRNPASGASIIYKIAIWGTSA